MPLKLCTLTGPDEYTQYGELQALSARFISHKDSLAEFGFLYCAAEDHHPEQGLRYPPHDYLQNMVGFHDMLPKPERIRMALHICGPNAIREFVDNAGSMVTRLARSFDRIQLNLQADKLDMQFLGRVGTAMKRHPRQTIITQHNEHNEQLERLLADHVANHAILFDASGGMGKLPPRWQAPFNGRSCGYAGGLGPDNITVEMLKISSVAGAQDYWIDMETRLRDKYDRFDLKRCEAVLKAAMAYTPR